MPPASQRLRAIDRLRAHGIAISLRIDPLYPRDPLPCDLFGKVTLNDYGVQPAQTEADLRYLVQMASHCGCESIIFSGLKIPRALSPRNLRLMQGWINFYQSYARKFPNLNSQNYLRLPFEYQHGALIQPLVHEAERLGIKTEHCKNNLIHAR